ncbi:Mitochodrial transcription termination factor-related protein [Corchorus olitorius]|uniref:Mitochodrial transcription termination factor-related protein n=1 Tax=Corchorus olitorius TaxID=93759 RepID=A0A1R3JUM1_9ROSI|nr:Mitochodrial transcription termination factor-related protein [Corchorus olitorius]
MFNLSRRNVSIFQRVIYNVVNDSSLFLRVRFISKNSLDSDPSQSFGFSYFVNKFGFSKTSALAASKIVVIKTPNKPEAVIAFLEKQGFSETQIKHIVRVRPTLLNSNIEKTLVPKFEYFLSKGVSTPDLIKLLFHNPRILSRSLENQIIPCVTHLHNLIKCDSKVFKAIKRHPYIFSCKLEAYLLPNIKLLLDSGVPESNIIERFVHHPRSFIMVPDEFAKIVKEVKDMGFNPFQFKFLLAVIMFRRMSKSTLQRKFDGYKKYGWSEQQCWEAFRICPPCMEASEQKIMATMDFLLNEMGLQSSLIVKKPYCLAGNSLENRLVPRGLFAQELLSRGLIESFSLSGLFKDPEKKFLERFVYQYEDKAPELLELYKEKVKIAQGGKYRIGNH